MAKIVKIRKIEFNRHIVKVGEVQSIDFDSFELDDNVVGIYENGHIDKSFYIIEFKDKTFQDIFDVNRVYWLSENSASA